VTDDERCAAWIFPSTTDYYTALEERHWSHGQSLMPCDEYLRGSRMREICTSGLRRGEAAAFGCPSPTRLDEVHFSFGFIRVFGGHSSFSDLRHHLDALVIAAPAPL
jgi:hypothetical protein